MIRDSADRTGEEFEDVNYGRGSIKIESHGEKRDKSHFSRFAG